MGKKVDSDCVRVHLNEGGGALCTSGAKRAGWSYSDDPKNVTCPKCLLAWGMGIAKQLGKENTRANQAEDKLFASNQRAEEADKAWKQAQHASMNAWGVANKRIEEIVEITAREQNALSALRAVMKLV